MVDKKLIIFDLDGTLLNSENKILLSSLVAIKELKKKGHIVTIATGRSRFLCQDIINQLQLNTYVLCNGAIAFYENQPIIDKPLSSKLLNDLRRYFITHDMDMALTGIDEMVRVTDNHTEKFESVMSSLNRANLLYDSDFIDNTAIYQGLGFYDETKDGTFEERFPELRFVRWLENCVDIIDKDMSKATTLIKLAHHIGIKKENIIAFGDGLNDIEMLTFAGVGVAMGNAHKKTKSVANRITESNDNDGIFLALKELEII